MTEPVMDRLRRANPSPPTASGDPAEWPAAALDLLTAEHRPAASRRSRRRAGIVAGVALAGAVAASAIGAVDLMSERQSPGDHAAGMEDVIAHHRQAFGVGTTPPGGVFSARPGHAPDLATGSAEDGFARWAVWLLHDGGLAGADGLWAATPSMPAAARADCPAPDDAGSARACLHEPDRPAWPSAFGVPPPPNARAERYITGRIGPAVRRVDVVDAEGVTHAALTGNGLFLAAGLPAPAARLLVTDAAGATAEVAIAPPASP